VGQPGGQRSTETDQAQIPMDPRVDLGAPRPIWIGTALLIPSFTAHRCSCGIVASWRPVEPRGSSREGNRAVMRLATCSPGVARNGSDERRPRRVRYPGQIARDLFRIATRSGRRPYARTQYGSRTCGGPAPAGYTPVGMRDSGEAASCAMRFGGRVNLSRADRWGALRRRAPTFPMMRRCYVRRAP
jgi:hypothetical protein